MEKKINYQFKILYFFGILFIVACHCSYGGISLGYEWFYPGAFHLALFAFGSGYFYKTSSEDHILAYIWKKFKHLMVPVLLWNAASTMGSFRASCFVVREVSAGLYPTNEHTPFTKG